MATTPAGSGISLRLVGCYPLKIREDGRYQSKAVYTVLALNLEGKKEILGLYLYESEGANFWLSVLTDLQNRGVNDILIACVGGLTGFPEAINSIYPDTEVQLCVIHQIRKVIYTTNAIESVHRQFRKLTKTKGAFPNENSL